LGFSFGLAFVTLILRRPDLLPWSMVFAQGFFMISSWRPFGKQGYISIEELKTLLFPAILMTLPLIFSNSIYVKFGGSALAYVIGLGLAKKIIGKKSLQV